jgi:tetratricopeptide (TPR) repeat protein
MYERDEDEDRDAFSKVDEISALIDGLVKGTVDVADVEKYTKKAFETEGARKLQQQQEEADRKALENAKLLKGEAGKGRGINYKWFCLKCFWEFRVNLPENKCNKCGRELMTSEARNEQLMAKTNILIEEKNKRIERRNQFNVYKKQKMLDMKVAGGTDYSEWDSWEPDSDDSDLEPIIPQVDVYCFGLNADVRLCMVLLKSQGPEFKAMERDIEMRAAKRQERAKKADQLKKQGNTFFDAGDLDNALCKYTEAIETLRDDKAIYTNRALVLFKLKKYKKCILDCTSVLDMWEYLEEKRPFVGNEPVFKSYTRRAMAQRELRNYAEAKADLDQALLIMPGNAQCKKLLAQNALDMAEKNREAEVRAKALAIEEARKREQEKLAQHSVTAPNGHTSDSTAPFAPTQVEETKHKTKSFAAPSVAPTAGIFASTKTQTCESSRIVCIARGEIGVPADDATGTALADLKTQVRRCRRWRRVLSLSISNCYPPISYFEVLALEDCVAAARIATATATRGDSAAASTPTPVPAPTIVSDPAYPVPDADERPVDKEGMLCCAAVLFSTHCIDEGQNPSFRPLPSDPPSSGEAESPY